LSASANGVNEQDVIRFNISDITESGRTIILVTQLPNISSNLIIDASTQSGLKFGISSAKVKLLTEFPYQGTYYGFALSGVNHVEIYGFYIQNLIAYNPMEKRFAYQGISINNCTDVKVGAAGKGNVISGFYYNMGFNIHEGGQIRNYSEDITVQDNFIGIEADGFTLSANQQSALRADYVYGKVVFGGNENEGNLIPAGFELHQQNNSESTSPGDRGFTLPADILIANNKIGVDYNITSGYAISRGIFLSTGTPNGKNTILVEDNVISSTLNYGIYIINIGRQVTVRHNFIGTDKTLTKKLPVSGIGIFVYWSDHVLIGGDDPADGNYIGYCKPVVVWPYSIVAVKKNSFFCTVNAYPMIELDTYRPITKISMDLANTTQVKGTATPNSVIELFYSDKCGTCSPQTYFASTTADANGNWEYNGTITGAVIASATYNNSTSEFTRTVIDISKAYMVSTCSITGGIIGVVPKTNAAVQWVDIDGNVVGTEANLKNVAPGKYKLQVIGIDCPVETGYFEVKKSIEIISDNVIITNPSCGKANGALRDLVVRKYTSDRWKVGWKDKDGVIVSQAFDLDNVKPGSYTFTASLEDNSCSVSYGPIKFVNIGGVTIDEEAVSVIPTDCGKKDGAVTGLKITSEVPPIYNWKNSEGKIVAYSKDLINQPAGDYYLEVSNSGNCGIITSSVFTITELNGITIVDKGAVKPSTCENNNGAITGITVSGATDYEWFDEQSRSIAKSNTPDLTNIAAGKYFLVSSNQFCSKTTKVYTVPKLQNNTDYGVADIQLVNARCGLVNGSIKTAFKVPVFSYRWVDKQTGNTLNENSSFLQNIEAGTYSLYLSDENGCEKFYANYNILREPEIELNESEVIINNDFCGLGLGSIKGINLNGKAPFSYKWINEKGEVIGMESSISGLKSGDYRLNIVDRILCEKNYTFSILERSKIISQPNVGDLQICAPGALILIISNSSPEFGYRLYDNLESTIPIDEQKNGRFNITVNKNRSYYVTQFTGDCESLKKEVKITVGFNLYNIPNTFSPNQDGVNDTWILKNIENYPNVSVKVFNRVGAIVFESQKYQTPFDGKSKGVDLPIGVYYYQIKVSDNCDPISGSLTIMR